MNSFHLEIVTPDGVMYDGKAESLLVRTSDGDVEILAGHADYVATVAVGRTRIIDANGTSYASSVGGFLSVKKGEVRLVATTFEFGNSIDVERAKKAKENAEEAIKNAKDERAMRIASAKLKRALNRINVAGMK